MNRNSKAPRASLARALAAGLAFALTCAVTALPGGGIGIGTVEAKGKGGGNGNGAGGGDVILKTSNAGGNGKSATSPGKSGQTREANAGGKPASSGKESAQARRDARAGGNSQAPEGTENSSGTSSQLKNRNAATASESAFANAAPNSNVGRISSYRDAARATLDKKADIQALDDDLTDLRLARELALAQGDQTTADQLGGEILGLEDQRRVAADDLFHLQAIEDEAYLAVGGPELNDHDYNAFRSMLGLE